MVRFGLLGGFYVLCVFEAIFSYTSFSRRHDAARHVRTMNGGRKYRCNIWQVSFKNFGVKRLVNTFILFCYQASRYMPGKIIETFTLRNVSRVSQQIVMGMAEVGTLSANNDINICIKRFPFWSCVLKTKIARPWPLLYITCFEKKKWNIIPVVSKNFVAVL